MYIIIRKLRIYAFNTYRLNNIYGIYIYIYIYMVINIYDIIDKKRKYKVQCKYRTCFSWLQNSYITFMLTGLKLVK